MTALALGATVMTVLVALLHNTSLLQRIRDREEPDIS